MKKVCSNCTLSTEDLSANFCSNCGGALVMHDEKQSVHGPLMCNNCGNMAVDLEMNFCAKCGNPLKNSVTSASVSQAPVMQQSIPPVQSSPPSNIIYPGQNVTIRPISPDKFFNLNKLFSTAHATVNYKDKNLGGKLVLAVEGIGFKSTSGFSGYTSSHYGIGGGAFGSGRRHLNSVRFLIPYEAIKGVRLGEMEKSFIVDLVDGNSKEFKLYNPSEWILKIQEQMDVLPSQ
ncbi:MAG: zinc ribbon domain-containing protein [Candidatus Hodarchaeota archaeon]